MGLKVLACMEALKDRFDPSSRHELYLAELLGSRSVRARTGQRSWKTLRH